MYICGLSARTQQIYTRNMGLGKSKLPQSEDEGRVVTIDSLDNWKAKFESSKTSGKLMVIDFTATWCGPCKMMAPIFREFADEFEAVEFIKIDVDKFKDIAKDFEVQSMPTFVVVRYGKEVGRVVGADKDELHRMIKQHHN